MTCENYYQDADVISFLSKPLNINTMSYQYSNISEIGPLMMTSAETFFSFSSMFARRWSSNEIKPKYTINIGYTYSSSFNLINSRAKEKRDELKKKNIKFTICYFDESVQDDKDKYGTIGKKDHHKEILELARAVLADHSLAIIIKTQFYFNNPSILYSKDSKILSAMRTGRLIELSRQGHRNNIFPAEAAMSSDIVIGHAVGATAGLEAALVSKRCILLNPYNMKGKNIQIFKNEDILYNNIESALIAISNYRKNNNQFKTIGDWKNIIHNFVKYQDDQSSARLKTEIERLTLS